MSGPLLEQRTLTRIQRGDDADALALAAYARVLAMLDVLAPEDWSAVTDYRGWTVRDTVAHLIGSAGAHASVREFKRQLGHAKDADDDGATLAAITQLHISDQEDISDAELIMRLRARAPRAVEGRIGRTQWFGSSHLPGKRRRQGDEPSLAGRSLAELCNVTLARDAWLHGIDIANATGRPLEFRSDLDGALVSDLVGDWCDRHETPVELELTGPFGGRYSYRDNGRTLRLDALDFCRLAAGRAGLGPVPDDPLLRTRVPF